MKKRMMKKRNKRSELDFEATHYSPIREKMQHRTTEELQAIYKENDRDTWRPEAFAAIREILLERGDSVPEQDKTTEQDEAKKAATRAVKLLRKRRNLQVMGIVSIVLGIALIVGGLTVDNTPKDRNGNPIVATAYYTKSIYTQREANPLADTPGWWIIAGSYAQKAAAVLAGLGTIIIWTSVFIKMRGEKDEEGPDRETE